MMLWAILAVLTAGALAVLLAPLFRRSESDATPSAYDIAVYRNQLSEIADEASRGLISPDQADAARIEIQRRILAAAHMPELAAKPAKGYRPWLLILALAAAVPAAGAALYLTFRSPDLPGAAFAARIKHNPIVAEAAAADKLAHKLAAQPSADGYARLGDKYVHAQEFAEAVTAFRQAVMFGGDTGAIWSKLGEAIALDDGGSVSPQALAAFTHALMLDPSEPRARFYAGIAEAQIGRFRRAVAIWRDLERDSKPGAAWLSIVRNHIAVYARQGGFDPESVPPKPPSVMAMNAALGAMANAMRGNNKTGNKAVGK